MDQATPKKRINKAALKRAMRMFEYVWPHRIKFAIGLIFLFLSTFTFMAFPGLIGRLIGGEEAGDNPIDRVFNIQNIDQVALLLVVAFALQALFSFMRIYLFADVTERAIARIRQDVYAHLIRLPMAFFHEQRVGELNSRISNDISQLQDTFMTTLAELIRQVITIIFGIALLFFFSVELTLVMLVSLPVMMIAAMIFGRFIRKLSKATQHELAQSQVVVDESLQGIQSVKAFANEDFEVGRYTDITEHVRQVAMRGAKWRGAFASFIIFGLLGAVVLVIWYGVRLRIAGEISLDVLTSFILYSAFVGGSIGGMADIFGKIQKAVGATESLFDLMEEPLEYDAAANPNGNAIALKGQIAFKDVHFSYPSRPDKPVLEGLSFDALPGQRLAIVGPSGAGKSTIVSLVLQFYRPDRGGVFFDELPATGFHPEKVRSQVALVPQEVMLFGGSIRQNIAYGRPSASENEIIEAARQAMALDFIESFPDGMDTLVGERGVQLSGGQRQRIAIARAILKDPRILLLDEATSSLDAESERLVQLGLEKLMAGRTSIIIAHRLSTIRKADIILVLDQGKIAERGTHEELMMLDKGIYRNMSELQVLA